MADWNEIFLIYVHFICIFTVIRCDEIIYSDKKDKQIIIILRIIFLMKLKRFFSKF